MGINLSKPEYYVQCTLRRKSGNGYLETVGWIEEKLAVVGKHLKMHLSGGETRSGCLVTWNEEVWEEGWYVIGTGARREKSYLREKSRDYLHQREASDV